MGVWGMLPQKILKIMCPILAKIAFYGIPAVKIKLSSNNLLKTFNKFSIIYKMHENFPSMRVSVRMYQIACVSHRMRETWKV